MIRERNFSKKTTLLFIFLMVFCFNIHAGEKFKGGFKGGINLSSYISKNSIEHYWAVGSAGSSMSSSFTCGALISYSFNKYLTLQTELLYSQKKCHVEYENQVHGSGDYYFQCSKWDGFQELVYFEFPFLIKSTLILFQKEICKPYAGIYYSTLLDKKYEYDFSYVAKNIEGEITDSYKRKIIGQLSDVKNNDVGIILGAEINLSKMFKPLFLDTRLSISLDKVNESTIPGSVKNLTLLCSIGMKF